MAIMSAHLICCDSILCVRTKFINMRTQSSITPLTKLWVRAIGHLPADSVLIHADRRQWTSFPDQFIVCTLFSRSSNNFMHFLSFNWTQSAERYCIVGHDENKIVLMNLVRIVLRLVTVKRMVVLLLPEQKRVDSFFSSCSQTNMIISRQTTIFQVHYCFFFIAAFSLKRFSVCNFTSLRFQLMHI